MSATWTHGVVVGFDSSPDSLQALRWAAHAAARHDGKLTVVTAYTAPYGMSGGTFDETDVRETLLEKARQAIRASRLPESLEVGVRAEPGSAVHLLVTRSRTADLVVVGRSERAGLDQLVLGPVSCPTAAMARGPVAVVPLRARPGRPRRLVACVDPEHDPTTVLDFAFDEARAAERPVRIVHALEPARSAEALSAQLTGSGASRRPTSQELAELLEVWSTKYTDVDRTITVRRGPAAAALLQEVADDDLVVLGGRRHPRVVGRLLGSVPDAVLRQAPCTAVVVHSRDER